jgi:uncharacterized membrane protein
LQLPNHHKVEVHFFILALLIVSMDTAFGSRRQNTATAVQSSYLLKKVEFLCTFITVFLFKKPEAFD